MARQRSHGTTAHPHGHKSKKFPNGVKATLKSIRRFWPRDIRPGPGRSVKRFTSGEFLSVYNQVQAHYGLKKSKSETALANIVGRLEGSGDKFISDLRFSDLRAYALFTGIPTGLLLVFTQAVTYEVQGRGREHIGVFLDHCCRAMLALEKYARDTPLDGTAFHESKVDDCGDVEIKARLQGLIQLVAAYREI